MSKFAACLLVTLLLSLIGCGTLTNGYRTPAEGGMRPFGGVVQDLTAASDDATPLSSRAASVADVPFSLVADALTLGTTLPATFRHDVDDAINEHYTRRWDADSIGHVGDTAIRSSTEILPVVRTR